MKKSLIIICSVLMAMQVFAQRQFIHPGISFTQSDLDRMRAMVSAKQEPFYSTYQKMLADGYTGRGARSGLTQIKEGQYNNIIGVDGRAALQQALVWKISGNTTYADKAVAILNSYAGLTNCSHRGTAPLDAGKIYMLIDAAELMRDYSGWTSDDQRTFKNMLVYPGYSTKVKMDDKYATINDSTNQVTFYWNIYNGDPNRFGNQGIFGLRGLIAMGIFLDNDTIYDRAVRKFLSMPHRGDDLPYPSGPVESTLDASGSNAYYNQYNTVQQNVIEDYGYDDELKYYIYENGQSSELYRDQGHNMCGINNCAEIARVAWNQGDDIFSAYDGRILKGIEYNFNYNYSWKHQFRPTLWQQDSVFEPTIENGQFLSVMARCGRWKGLKANPWNGANLTSWSRGATSQCLVADLMQYKVRMGLPADSIKWLQRAYDYMMDSLGYEPGYSDSGHYYEYNGWGLCLNYRTPWMAGDAGTFVNDSVHVSGTPTVPCTINAVDYDFYNYEADGQGHTYNNIGKVRSNVYRKDGTPEIVVGNNGYVITKTEDGEWMNYTVNCSTGGTYSLSAIYTAVESGTSLYASIDGGGKKGREMPATEKYDTLKICLLHLHAGTQVIRIYVSGKGDNLNLSKFVLNASTESEDYSFVSSAWSPSAGSVSTDNGVITSLSYDGTTNQLLLDLNGVYSLDNARKYLVVRSTNMKKRSTYSPRLVKVTINGTALTPNKISTNFFNDAIADSAQIAVWDMATLTTSLGSFFSNADATLSISDIRMKTEALSSSSTSCISTINFYTLDDMIKTFRNESLWKVYGYPTSIKDFSSDKTVDQDNVYLLTGQKIDSRSNLKRGLYIVKGKKIVVR